MKIDMKKEIRERIYDKCGGHCAYCGKPITYKQMQVDHIVPLFRGLLHTQAELAKIKKGTNEESNMNPSCARCNKWKSAHSLEQFRKEVSKQCERLKRDSAAYRMALDYGLISEYVKPVVFYFERKYYPVHGSMGMVRSSHRYSGIASFNPKTSDSEAIDRQNYLDNKF